MATIKCPKCNNDIEEGSVKCPFCGKKIKKENDEGKFRKLYITLPVLLVFVFVIAGTWYFLTMDKRMVLKVKDSLVKDGYTCTFEETKEREKVSTKYIFGTSEVADVHCYKEDGQKVYIFEMFYVDSYRYNFYVIEDKDYKKIEETEIFRLSGLDYDIAKANIEKCEKLKKGDEEEFAKECEGYNSNSLKYFDMYNDVLKRNKVSVSSQSGK